MPSDSAQRGALKHDMRGKAVTFRPHAVLDAFPRFVSEKSLSLKMTGRTIGRFLET